jgi:branched-chain amino acid transport system permease protein
MDYYLHLAILLSIYLILAQGFNLQFGLGRLLNFSHVSCYAVGAYTTALLSTNLNYGFLTCIILSIATSIILSFILSLLALRISNDFFAIATIGFSSLITALLINWRSFTNGVLGIPGIPRPEIFGLSLNSNLYYLTLTSSSALLCMLLCIPLFYGSYSRSIRAYAENELAALALGKNIGVLRFTAFTIGAGLSGLAGSFFAYYINYVDPSSFAMAEMVVIFTIVVIGRPGSFSGTIIGTIFVLLVPEVLRFVDIPSSILGPARQSLYALLLYMFVYFNKSKLFPKTRSL